MTDVRRLPLHLDRSVEAVELVASIQRGELILDWRDVESVEYDVLRALLDPFVDRMAEFEDALGVMSMPEAIEADVNFVLGLGPEPGRRPKTWLVIQKADSTYDDVAGHHYEYPGSIPNGRQVAVGDMLVLSTSQAEADDGRRIFGVGEIATITERPDGRLQAHYATYERIEPRVRFDDVGGDPRSNRTNAINRIPRAFAERVQAFEDTLPTAAKPDAETPRLAPTPPSTAADQLDDLDLTTGDGVRDAMHRIIALDLLGPAGGPDEELLDDAPRTRYVVGTLAPKGEKASDLATVDELDGAGESGNGEGDAEGKPAASSTLFASSIGLTFVVAAGVESISIEATWGAFDRVQSELHETAKGQPRMVWRRTPAGTRQLVPLDVGTFRFTPDADHEGVEIVGSVRPPGNDGSKIVTLFLVNGQGELDQLQDRAWVFQPRIAVSAADGQSAVFVRRDAAVDIEPDDGDSEAEERALLSMSHRKHAEFAIGHGVAVRADAAADPWVDDIGWERATSISTTVLPWYDVPVTETPSDDELADDLPGFEGFELDMAALAEMPKEQLVEMLDRIPLAYRQWIDVQSRRIGRDPDLVPHAEAARRAIEKAEIACDRLAEGVRVIAGDPDALEAFRFANRAMRTQRLRSVYAQRRRRGDDVDYETVETDETATWRAFQIAFLLLNVPTATDTAHPKRNLTMGAYADLLWFPTGGGKTEAYLGVAAYSIGIRRLQGEQGGYAGDGGVSVIMRYTLRLLTLQQFQRASTLVCAMERIRIAEPDTWGSEPFRIGLWVGGNSTPNSTYESARWVNENKGAHEWDSGRKASSPLQLTNCPWCGEKLGPDNVTVEQYKSGRGRTFLHCRNRHCDFTKRQSDEGIPVVTVDEEIYRTLPTFLLATVDKFAQMPWRGEVQSLFGRVHGRCDRHGWLGSDADCQGAHNKSRSLPASSLSMPPAKGFRPPDLIIQDELHLISGPLGTLVGLYETAVDALCDWELDGVTVRPKVIAATATTRRAAEQVHQLFCREVAVFPPIGIDADDNFFARQRSPETLPGRRYLGVCSPGRSRPSVLIRVYVASLCAAQWLWENIDEADRHLVDPYLTLLGYFNSLRELGGMRRLVDDDVSTRVFRIERDDRPGLARRSMFPEGTQELTSRIRSSKIPDLLDQLEVPFTADTEKRADGTRPPKPLDVVLATNMVSVGVDVQRLGLMVVSGQPKATAEYIQASSRVGRSHPGLVVTVLNWARPRDLSHYEQFEHYHAVFYRYVEALSVTPFAPRALTRGLTGVLASMIRLDGREFNPNAAAELVKGAGQFPEIVDTFASRAQDATFPNEEHVDVGSDVRQALTARLDEWAGEAATPNRRLGYRSPKKKDDVTVGLLEPPSKEPWGSFTVPTSMREVEPGVGLVLGGRTRDHLPSWTFAEPEDES